MKTKSVIFILGVLLFITTPKTLASWEIYNDTDIPSGTYGLIDIYDSPPDNTTVNFYGDVADYIGTHNSSTLNFYDGQAEIGAFDDSLVNVSGGTLSAVRAWNDVTVNFSGNSSASSLSASHSSTVNMTGGNVDHVGSSESGIFNLYGGIVIDRIYATDFGQINIYGHDLTKTTSGGYYGCGQVWGYLTDDTYICVDLANPEAYNNTNLIPEPATIALLLIGTLYIRNKRSTR